MLQKTKACCPKCKSKDLLLTESCHASITWTQKDGMVDLEKGTKEYGEAFSIKAVCLKCEHGWFLRNARQISDIISE